MRKVKRRVFRRRVRYAMNSMAELKHLTYNYSSLTIDWSGQWVNLNALAVSGAASGRIGRRVTPKSVTWNLTFTNTAQNDPHTVSMFVIRDTQTTNGAAPTAGQLLNTVGANTAPNSLVNLDNTGRFKILMRKQFVLEDRDSGDASFVMRKSLRVRPIPITFDGDASTNWDRNCLWVMFISSADPAAGNVVGVTGSVRIAYTDS